MMIKGIKIGLLILASLLMGAVITFISEVSIIDTISASYFLVMNMFLGVDLAAMLKKSAQLPKGEFKKMNLYKYILSLVIMLGLFGLAMYRKETANIQAIMTISSLGGGSMLIIGFIMTGLEGNKIASNIGD